MDDLSRFIKAQDEKFSENVEGQRFIVNQTNSYDDALKEIRNGQKQGHWIWYIFPQLKGLGHSYNSQYYGIKNADEARSYLSHPLLGARLREITQELLDLPNYLTAEKVFGGLDALKLRSSMTLFYFVSKEQLFEEVLYRFYQGKVDSRTWNMLEESKQNEI